MVVSAYTLLAQIVAFYTKKYPPAQLFPLKQVRHYFVAAKGVLHFVNR